MVGVDREGQEVTRELCLNNEEPSHGDLREEPSVRGWMRCLLSAHAFTGFWIKFVEASQRAKGDLEGQEGRFSVWRNRGSSSTPRDREKEIATLCPGRRRTAPLPLPAGFLVAVLSWRIKQSGEPATC